MRRKEFNLFKILMVFCLWFGIFLFGIVGVYLAAQSITMNSDLYPVNDVMSQAGYAIQGNTFKKTEKGVSIEILYDNSKKQFEKNGYFFRLSKKKKFCFKTMLIKIVLKNF